MPDIVRQLAEACRPVLVETARRRDIIPYGKLAQRVRSEVNLPELNGNDQRLHDALDVLSKESYDEGQNLLVSVVIVREDTGTPGVGFYYLAREVLGAYPPKTSKEEIFAAELEKVHQRYSRSSEARSRRRSGSHSAPE